MLIHLLPTCCSEVDMDLSKAISFITRFQLTNTGVKPLAGALSKKENPGISLPDFFCNQCSKFISIDEVGIRCHHCGRETPVKQLWKSPSCGGLYCASCFAILKLGSERINVAVLLTKVDFD